MRQGAPLQLELVQLVVWEDKKAVPFQVGGLTGGVLKNFCEWVSALRPTKGDPLYWQHALLLTG